MTGVKTFMAAAPEAEAAAPAPAPGPLDKYKAYLPHAIGGAVALFAVVGLVLLRRSRKKARAEKERLATVTVTPTSAQIEGVEITPMLPPRDEALRRAEEDPATAALIIRHWLGGAEQETQRAAV
jgi:hypothetical protein